MSWIKAREKVEHWRKHEEKGDVKRRQAGAFSCFLRCMDAPLHANSQEHENKNGELKITLFVSHVVNVYEINVDSVFAFSNVTIVLSWLKSN